uniref:Uncharacterized protein n=1 Tax=Arundo donax TaxID=35708 RepID=A0A0A9C267_ARUDO
MHGCNLQDCNANLGLFITSKSGALIFLIATFQNNNLHTIQFWSY